MGFRIEDFATKSYINPECVDIDILYVKRYRSSDNKTQNPSFWFIYNNLLYFGICYNYELDFLEMFDEWEIKDYPNESNKCFNDLNPALPEVIKLMSFKPILYKIDYQKLISSDLDQFSEWEMRFIKIWWLDFTISKILD